MRAGISRNPITDHHSGIEIDDHTEVEVIVVYPKLRDIADPNLIGACCNKISFQPVFSLFALDIIILFFRGVPNTL